MNKKVAPISVNHFSSSRGMPIFILVEKVVCIKSALIMSFPARTINKTPLKAYQNSHLWSSIGKMKKIWC